MEQHARGTVITAEISHFRALCELLLEVLKLSHASSKANDIFVPSRLDHHITESPNHWRGNISHKIHEEQRPQEHHHKSYLDPTTHPSIFIHIHCCCYQIKWDTPTTSTQLPLPKLRGCEPGVITLVSTETACFQSSPGRTTRTPDGGLDAVARDVVLGLSFLLL